jgi:hypothetical protein
MLWKRGNPAHSQLSKEVRQLQEGFSQLVPALLSLVQFRDALSTINRCSGTLLKANTPATQEAGFYSGLWQLDMPV